MSTATFPSEREYRDERKNKVSDESDSFELTPATWKDPKRYAWMLATLIPAAPFAAWGLVDLTGWTAFWFIGPALIFAVFPVLDFIVGEDSTNPPDSVLAWLEEDRYYRWITYGFLPLQFAGIIFACWMWAYGELSTVADVGLALTIGTIGGLGINTAHELGHKRESLERWLSKIALAQTFYGHFFIEHNRGHHVRVATPEDPASSRFGENFYQFWPRTVAGSLRSAIHIESKRLQRANSSFWTIKNDLLNAWLMSIALFAALVGVFGWVVLPYLVLQAILGFSLLEVVNYLEHYGLVRQIKEDGRFERCMPSHSWNNNNIASNVFLYHLQRHSDHHAHPTRRYQALRSFDEAPNLPTGYAGMIVLALFPPAWRRVMDKRVIEHYRGDISRANILPRKRAKVLAKFGPSDHSGKTASFETQG
ncbi:MAG: alkane 1-monooxygenase [Solirubrobacterales bacterium]